MKIRVSCYCLSSPFDKRTALKLQPCQEPFFSLDTSDQNVSYRTVQETSLRQKKPNTEWMSHKSLNCGDILFFQKSAGERTKINRESPVNASIKISKVTAKIENTKYPPYKASIAHRAISFQLSTPKTTKILGKGDGKIESQFSTIKKAHSTTCNGKNSRDPYRYVTIYIEIAQAIVPWPVSQGMFCFCFVCYR